MKRRSITLFLAVAMLVGSMLSIPSGASAGGFATISGAIRKDVWRYYGTQRVVTRAPYEIAFMKGDGPTIGMRYYGCGVSDGREFGREVNIRDNDPPYEWRYLRDEKWYGVTFCLGAKSYGGNDTDTFAGDLAWD